MHGAGQKILHVNVVLRKAKVFLVAVAVLTGILGFQSRVKAQVIVS